VKQVLGRFFEDFAPGEAIRHATPRTVTEGDASLYTALYGSRFAVQSSDAFAKAIGYPRSPLDDLLVFHTVFGKTVPDISLNAVANLGYADGRFLKAVYPGGTLSAVSEVIGLKESSNRQTGVVTVRTTGFDGAGDDGSDLLPLGARPQARPRGRGSAGACAGPAEGGRARGSGRGLPADRGRRLRLTLAGSPHRWGDYAPGERIDHVDGMTVEEAEHQLATRLYQNTARVHFDGHAAAGSRFGRRLIYGGHVISLARALSFNGLANAFHVAAINAGRHVAPLFAGDTVYAWSEIWTGRSCRGGRMSERCDAARRGEKPAVRRLSGTGTGDGYNPAVILDLDYWALIPR
jgi:2-methylfumaryl-CoA hydratase